MTPERLGSRYLLEERVGEGGLGVVWRGRDVSTGTVYAIKLLKAEFAQDPATVSRFVRERTALLRFRHPNVVTLHDMIVEGDRLALVMDFIANGDLKAYRQRRGGVLSSAEATELTAQMCGALAAAHAAGIVHRDLKPANVLLDSGGEPGVGVGAGGADSLDSGLLDSGLGGGGAADRLRHRVGQRRADGYDHRVLPRHPQLRGARGDQRR